VRDSLILGVSGVLLLGGVVAAAAQVDLGSEAVVDSEGDSPSTLGDDTDRPTGAGVTKSADGELAADWDDEQDPDDPDDEEEEGSEDEEEEKADKEGNVNARTPSGPSSTEDGPTTTAPPAPSQTTAPPASQPAQNPVPGVVGMSESQARSTLAAHGLDMVVQYVRVWDGNQDGKVQSQSPGGGSPKPSDGKVRVTVGQWCLLIC
jgi:hypothetical protein